MSRPPGSTTSGCPKEGGRSTPASSCWWPWLSVTPPAELCPLIVKQPLAHQSAFINYRQPRSPPPQIAGPPTRWVTSSASLPGWHWKDRGLRSRNRPPSALQDTHAVGRSLGKFGAAAKLDTLWWCASLPRSCSTKRPAKDEARQWPINNRRRVVPEDLQCINSGVSYETLCKHILKMPQGCANLRVALPKADPSTVLNRLGVPAHSPFAFALEASAYAFGRSDAQDGARAARRGDGRAHAGGRFLPAGSGGARGEWALENTNMRNSGAIWTNSELPDTRGRRP